MHHDVNRHKKSTTVLFNVSKIFVRHHCTLQNYTYGERNKKKVSLWVNQVTCACWASLWCHNTLYIYSLMAAFIHFCNTIFSLHQIKSCNIAQGLSQSETRDFGNNSHLLTLFNMAATMWCWFIFTDLVQDGGHKVMLVAEDFGGQLQSSDQDLLTLWHVVLQVNNAG